MKLEFEYGNGTMSAELPDNTDVFIPGTTIPDPPCLPQDWEQLYAATLESIRHPIGMKPLRNLAGPGKRVVFVIPDIVKGGTQATAHRKVSIRACLDELYGAGVEKRMSCFCSPMACIHGPPCRRCEKFWGRSCFGNFIPRTRLQATIARIMRIWWTWAPHNGVTRF